MRFCGVAFRLTIPPSTGNSREAPTPQNRKQIFSDIFRFLIFCFQKVYHYNLIKESNDK